MWTTDIRYQGARGPCVACWRTVCGLLEDRVWPVGGPCVACWRTHLGERSPAPRDERLPWLYVHNPVPNLDGVVPQRQHTEQRHDDQLGDSGWAGILSPCRSMLPSPPPSPRLLLHWKRRLAAASPGFAWDERSQAQGAHTQSLSKVTLHCLNKPVARGKCSWPLGSSYKWVTLAAARAWMSDCCTHVCQWSLITVADLLGPRASQNS
jgi:hypothetical protein